MAKIYDKENNKDVVIGRLERFRSYSYYHVVAICADSATAHALASYGNFPEMWEHPSNPLEADLSPSECVNIMGGNVVQDTTYMNSKYLPVNFSDRSEAVGGVSIDGAGKYVILINGSTDARFVINNYVIHTVSGTTHNTNSTSQASMNITEPLGIGFMDEILRAYHTLGTNHESSIYVVKTFFVGYQFEPGGSNNDTVQIISDIPAAQYNISGIAGKITETGSDFDITLAGCESQGAQAKYDVATVSIPVNPPDKNKPLTIKQAVDLLKAKLNDVANKQYDCVVSQTIAALKNSSYKDKEEVQKLIDEGIADKLVSRVQYEIELDKTYWDTKYAVDITGDANTTDNHTQNKGPRTIKFRAGDSIINTIRTEIMQQSEQVVKKDVNKITYNISAHQEITPKGDCVRETLIRIKIDAIPDINAVDSKGKVVNPTPIPTQILSNSANSDELVNIIARENNSWGDKLSEVNVVVFDYIYTGHNIDIIEMDIGITQGLAYLQAGRVVQPWKPSNKNFQQDSVVVPNIGRQRDLMGAFVGPITAVNPSVISLNDTNKSGNQIHSRFNINVAAGVNISDVSIKIRGNDAFLYNLAGTDPTSAEQVAESYADNIQHAFRDFIIQPKAARINISFPQTSDTTALVNSGDTYATPFWHRGLYKIRAITHNFIDGEFTQELMLMGMLSADQNSYNTQGVDNDQTNDTGEDVPCGSAQSLCAETRYGVPTSIAITALPITNIDGPTANFGKINYFKDDITVLDQSQKYWKLTRGPDPSDPNKRKAYNPPVWISQELKIKYDAYNTAKDNSINDKNAIRYFVEPVLASDVSTAIRTVYSLLRNSGISTSDLQTVGNKIKCTELVRQQQGENITPSTRTSAIDSIPANRTALALPPVLSGKDLQAAASNYDEIENLNKQATRNNIPAYTKMPKEDRAEMDRAFTDYKADEAEVVMMLLMMSKESGGNKNNIYGAQNDPLAQRATGLFQFLGTTWDDQVKKGLVPGVTPNTPNARALRTDVYKNTAAAINYTRENAKNAVKTMRKRGVEIDRLDPTEIYLIHNFGAGFGGNIVKDKRAGYVNKEVTWEMTGRDASPELYAKFRANNKIPANVITVLDWYVELSRRLNNQIKI